MTCHNIADSQCASLSRPQACSVSGVGGQNIDQQGLAGSLCNFLGQFRLFLVYFIAGVKGCDKFQKNLHDKLADGSYVRGDAGNHFFGPVVLIKPERQMNHAVPEGAS